MGDMVAGVVIGLDILVALVYFRTQVYGKRRRGYKKSQKTNTNRVYVEKLVVRNNNLKYFYNCVNERELHIRYRELCKKHHPDAGGNIDEFYKIQNEYHKISKEYKVV